MSDNLTDNDVKNFLDIVEEFSIRSIALGDKPPIDWNIYREKVAEILQSHKDVWSFINQSLKALEDNHNYIPDPTISGGFIKERIPPISGEIINNGGYIRLPKHYMQGHNALSDVNIERFKNYANTLQSIIADLDEHNPSGWIVDLRINVGGAYFPMLTGLVPFLGEGVHGHFKYAKEKYDHPFRLWDYPLFLGLLDTQYKLKNEKPPIAVLTGDYTCSSGEVISVAFKGLPNVQSFGEHTAKMSTGNVGFILEAHPQSPFLLASSIMADRNMNQYPNGLKPDVPFKSELTYQDLIREDYTPSTDPLVQKAADWVIKQSLNAKNTPTLAAPSPSF